MQAPPRAPPMPDRGSDYYQVLGVPFGASEKDIRDRYHAVVRTLHPDRRRPGDEVTERFHQVQSAWRCLSDTTRRLLYDLRNFGHSSLGGSAVAEEKLVCLQKEQALRDVENMQVVLEKILRRERKAKGILIHKALYGDLRLRSERLEECASGRRTIQESDLVGPVVEVTAPMQCLVEQHTIMLPGGAAASKADLPGFYNPAPLHNDVELSLYVAYEFKQRLHEIIVGDRETLSLPLRRHAVAAGKELRGPFSPANVLLMRQPLAAAPDERHSGRRQQAAPLVDKGAGAGSPAAAAAAACARAADQVLTKAVAEYRLASLLPAPEPGEATPRELLLVLLGAGVSLALAVWTTRRA